MKTFHDWRLVDFLLIFIYTRNYYISNKKSKIKAVKEGRVEERVNERVMKARNASNIIIKAVYFKTAEPCVVDFFLKDRNQY